MATAKLTLFESVCKEEDEAAGLCVEGCLCPRKGKFPKIGKCEKNSTNSTAGTCRRVVLVNSQF